jgi:predicted nucleic acid-binding protein
MASWNNPKLQSEGSTRQILLSLAVAERCARLREALRTQSKRVNSRALDLIIAATALEYDLTLITENLKSF